jgi:hypothetical protein
MADDVADYSGTSDSDSESYKVRRVPSTVALSGSAAALRLPAPVGSRVH